MIKEVFFAPHPPLAVHAIGQGKERRIQSTIDGYHQIAEAIGEIKPETIIFLSPHGNAFRDAFAVLQGEEVSGDFGLFGYSDVCITKVINGPLTRAIMVGLTSAGLGVVSLNKSTVDHYRVAMTLDHAALVPMHFIDSCYHEYSIVHITTGFMTPKEHFFAGEVLQKIALDYEGEVVVVASGDLSHALKEEGPYSYNAFGETFDGMVKTAITSKDVGPLLALTSEQIEAAAQCGLRSFCMGFGVMSRRDYDSEVFSYEGPFGVGYLTGRLFCA